MPTRLQASISSVPEGAVTFLPSTVSVTSAIFVAPAPRRQSVVRVPRALWPATACLGGDQALSGHHRFRRARFFIRARPAFQMILKFLAELFHERYRRHRRRITQRTKRPAQHVLREILHVIDIFFHAAAAMESSQCLLQPIRAFAAGDAPSATFMLVKLHRPQREFHYALLIV